jgi:hypothetical protein
MVGLGPNIAGDTTSPTSVVQAMIDQGFLNGSPTVSMWYSNSTNEFPDQVVFGDQPGTYAKGFYNYPALSSSVGNQEWGIAITNVTFGDNFYQTGTMSVIDSTNPYIVMPQGLWSTYKSTIVDFTPYGTVGGVVNCGTGLCRINPLQYGASCADTLANIPSFVFAIGKQTYTLPWQTWYYQDGNECVLLATYSSLNTWKFGQAFLSNFVTSFNYNTTQVSFA